jgi:hypothetical protein
VTDGISRRGFVGSAAAAFGAAAFVGTGACEASASAPAAARTRGRGTAGAAGAATPPVANDPTAPETSTFFATAGIEYYGSLATASDGDLWASCWADDGAIYAANGDGRGFSSDQNDFADIVVNRIDGTPETGITGTRLAGGAQVGPVWSDPSKYNRKPTGMTCVDGVLYLAVQDLRFGPGAFDDAPAASISRSDDHGRTWHPTSAPMFTDHRFTTVFFLDFGRNGDRAPAALGPLDSAYVYAYGLDGNWRDSYVNSVPDPASVYLARVPKHAVQSRAEWQFFTGTGGGPARATWSSDINAKQPVLTDTRRLYNDLNSSSTDPRSVSVISQGGVVYVPALRRYLYTSWTEYTYEFYESSTPWGPWHLFLHHDAGDYPWFGPGANVPGPKNGGYASTIPSKFISADGTSMWVQSNWFVGNGGGANNYQFNLRRLHLEPVGRVKPPRTKPATNLAQLTGAVPTEKSAHYGHASYYNDGDKTRSEDSWDDTTKPLDWWGYTWPYELTLGRVEYTTGTMFGDGGWFDNLNGGLRVQVRRGTHWYDVHDLQTTPQYPYDNTAGPFKTYSLHFTPVTGDGLRIIGAPGGTSKFTSIGELEVYSR